MRHHIEYSSCFTKWYLPNMNHRKMTEKHQTPGSSRSPSMSHQQHELAHNVAADSPQRHLMQQNRPGKAKTQKQNVWYPWSNRFECCFQKHKCRIWRLVRYRWSTPLLQPEHVWKPSLVASCEQSSSRAFDEFCRHSSGDSPLSVLHMQT